MQKLSIFGVFLVTWCKDGDVFCGRGFELQKWGFWVRLCPILECFIGVVVFSMNFTIRVSTLKVSLKIDQKLWKFCCVGLLGGWRPYFGTFYWRRSISNRFSTEILIFVKNGPEIIEISMFRAFSLSKALFCFAFPCLKSNNAKSL